MGCASSASSSQARAKLFHEKYEVQGKLGQGTFAEVRVCVKRDETSGVSDTSPCAVKIIECATKSARVDNRREAALWKRVTGHPHIVHLLETYTDERLAYFVMERCARSVYEMLSSKKHRPREAHLLVTIREMLLAIQHCHSVRVVHRDVKPANFLFSFDGTVKLCDFGLAELETRHGIVGRAGSAPFMSPEMVQGQRYNHKTDIWSLGATVYVMLYGDYPFQIRRAECHEGETPLTERELMHRAIATNSPQPVYVEEEGLRKPSLDAREFVRALLVRDPFERPNANECFHMKAMLIAYMKSMDTKKHKGGQWSESPREKLDAGQDALSADQIKGVQDNAGHTSEEAHAIDQLSRRLSPQFIAGAEDSTMNKRLSPEDRRGSQSSSSSSINSISPEDHKASSSSMSSASTADTGSTGNRSSLTSGSTPGNRSSLTSGSTRLSITSGDSSSITPAISSFSMNSSSPAANSLGPSTADTGNRSVLRSGGSLGSIDSGNRSSLSTGNSNFSLNASTESLASFRRRVESEADCLRSGIICL